MVGSTSTLDFVEDPSLLAEEHVDWFLEILRPLLISWFEHGYKHGKEDKDK
jgi:hypothetical protein